MVLMALRSQVPSLQRSLSHLLCNLRPGPNQFNNLLGLKKWLTSVMVSSSSLAICTLLSIKSVLSEIQRLAQLGPLTPLAQSFGFLSVSLFLVLCTFSFSLPFLVLYRCPVF